jgi:polyisoprenoid-binding protein YceI
MKTLKRLACYCAVSLAALSAIPTLAADYKIDTEGAHAFVQFRVKHLGYSWLYGRFNEFDGQFTYDPENPSKNSVEVIVDTASIDSNHAERDKHIRDEDFLHVKKYPQAKFVSTQWESTGESTAKLKGDLTLHGTTKPITIDVEHIGGGKDPWGGYRQGFEGRATIKPADFGIPMAEKLGPASAEVELMLTVEGIRQ